MLHMLDYIVWHNNKTTLLFNEQMFRFVASFITTDEPLQ